MPLIPDCRGYDGHGICAGDGDYTKWYPTDTVRRPCRSNYVERNENKSDFAHLGDTMRRLYESGESILSEYTEQ